MSKGKFEHKTKSLDIRLWNKVNKNGPVIVPELGQCWIWTGTTTHGYGKIHFGSHTKGTRKNLFAHIVAYELTCGPVPEGFELDHRCRNHSCVNPDHLEPVSHSVNIIRGYHSRYNTKKTHCPSGHPYDDHNTYITKNGKRMCRTCCRLRQRERMKNQKEVEYGILR